VVALLVLGAGSRARLAWPLYVGTGLIVGLALLSALSSLWSGSMELSVIEADRVLVYLGFFLAAFLIAQTDESRQRFAEGMALGITLVVLLGLFSRLLPHVMNVSDSLGSGPRLRYPLGYWNANGAMAGIAVAMLLWTSRRSAWAALRWLSAAAIPAVLLTLYFAYSRGGLLALAVAVGCLLALSRDRLWLLGTLAIGALGALPAILAVQARGSLADNLDRQASVDQGLTVFLILLAGIAGALLLYGLLRAFEARGASVSAASSPSPATRPCSAGSPPPWRSPLSPWSPRSAAAPGISSPAPTSSSPMTRPSISRSSRAPVGTTSSGSRSMPSKKSPRSGSAPAPTSSPGRNTARSTSR
jgi:hypothetical protein